MTQEQLDKIIEALNSVSESLDGFADAFDQLALLIEKQQSTLQ